VLSYHRDLSRWQRCQGGVGSLPYLATRVCPRLRGLPRIVNGCDILRVLLSDSGRSTSAVFIFRTQIGLPVAIRFGHYPDRPSYSPNEWHRYLHATEEAAKQSDSLLSSGIPGFRASSAEWRLGEVAKLVVLLGIGMPCAVKRLRKRAFSSCSRRTSTRSN